MEEKNFLLKITEVPNGNETEEKDLTKSEAWEEAKAQALAEAEECSKTENCPVKLVIDSNEKRITVEYPNVGPEDIEATVYEVVEW